MRKFLILISLMLFVLVGTSQAQTENGPVLVLNIEAPVTPVMANYFERGLQTAVSANAAAMLVVLDTPGGDLAVTQEIVQRFRNASLPIIVFVGPEGAQAASAGSLITAAAHAAAMAPGTVIGAASPINADGSDIDETLYRKAVEDLKASMRNLTDRRGPEAVELAEAMIEEARAVTSEEALEAGFIDIIAPDVNAVLTELDGLVVEVNGAPQTLNTANAVVERLPLNFLEQLLFILANPLLIGILLTIGAQALIFEITNPG
ncbi:MAG: ATP-dependent Clp protease proteolytic subunit, partial [Anaerolineales bacterium]|nr:ATP-dependent Clp protease proteolytic subunit [Anaerolineales bacterium]